MPLVGAAPVDLYMALPAASSWSVAAGGGGAAMASTGKVVCGSSEAAGAGADSGAGALAGGSLAAGVGTWAALASWDAIPEACTANTGTNTEMANAEIPMIRFTLFTSGSTQL